mgnify:CR=1 FL=1
MPAAILAGGQSTRMGSDKAMIAIDGIPLAVRTARVLKASGCTPIHLVGRQPALTTLGLPLITEENDAHHPLYGVSAALSQCTHELMLIAPCDIVNLARHHIQELLAYGQPCFAASGSQTHPLLGLFDVQSASEAHRIAMANGSVHEFTSGMPIVNLPSPHIVNANFPHDLSN